MSIQFTSRETFFNQEQLTPTTVNPLSDPMYQSSQSNTPVNIDQVISNTGNGSVQLNQGGLQSYNFVTGISGWRIDSEGTVEFGNGRFRGDITGATGTFTGTVNINALNIPDTTTTNSFHIDSAGNAWWGSNVAGGISNANASVTSAGLATFKNALVGGTTNQYKISDNGIYSFGDGSDGTVTFDGATTVLGLVPSSNTYTMTKDIYVTNMTVNSGVTLKPSGYRIFGTGTLTNSGIIQRDGNAGNAGAAVINSNNATKAGGAGGTALADGYLKGVDAGTNGADTGNSSTSGTNKTNSIGFAGVSGGAGASGGFSSGGSAGSPGTITTSNIKLIAGWHLQTLLDISSSGSTVKYDGSANSTGGGGGGSNASNEAGAGGGGAGSAGGILAIYFRNISNSGTISANGGTGGNGGAAGLSGRAGGGGGGGSGGNVVLVYNTITNSGTISANGGTGGTGANAGTNGNTGVVRQFQISL